MKLQSFNYQAIGLLGVSISHIIVHMSAFRLQQHMDQGMKNDGESITVSRIHKMMCNSYDFLGIKRVIPQGRTEQKQD